MIQCTTTLRTQTGKKDANAVLQRRDNQWLEDKKNQDYAKKILKSLRVALFFS